MLVDHADLVLDLVLDKDTVDVSDKSRRVELLGQNHGLQSDVLASKDRPRVDGMQTIRRAVDYCGVRMSVGRSVGRSVSWSVGQSVIHSFSQSVRLRRRLGSQAFLSSPPLSLPPPHPPSPPLLPKLEPTDAVFGQSHRPLLKHNLLGSDPHDTTAANDSRDGAEALKLC